MHDEDDFDHIHLSDSDDDYISMSEHVHLRSVGVDIGSSTSHLIFSDLVLERQGHRHSSRFVVTKRSVKALSPIHLTPYSAPTTIDVGTLKQYVADAYQGVGLSPDQIDTGAVIITGEAAKKENAPPILELFAGQAGKFVCASAGPNLEGILAAHGSGAVLRSRQGARTVLNVDIGGGTCKIAVVERGRVAGTCAINVGARLVAWDSDGIIVRLEEAGRQVAAACGYQLAVGQRLPDAARHAVAERLAGLVDEVISLGRLSPLAAQLMITPELTWRGQVDEVTYSGGVAEYIYGRETRPYGDLGPWLAAAVRQRALQRGRPALQEPAECLRATCIGASQYTVQCSGSTIHLSLPGLLPLRNLPVLVPALPASPEPAAVAEAVQEAFRRYDLTEDDGSLVALAIRWPYEPSHEAMHAFGRGLAAALPKTLEAARPLILVVDDDLGRMLGHLLREELEFASPVLCIDQVTLSDFDFIDIGGVLEEQQVVPVVVKSLVFK